VSPVRYELGFCITENGILHSHRREDLRSYKGSHKSVVHTHKLHPLCEVDTSSVSTVQNNI
jgi:hypothetical protein